MNSPFPIVGIGASAGGLEALGELLNALPAHPGMGFLIVQHLDPTHDSLLDELLSKTTAMPVVQAHDSAVIEIDHVYIIAPNTVMTVIDGRLRVEPRADPGGASKPIDALFASMAREAGPRSVGIILSGSGSDGALGSLAVKAAGGITFAQDAASARFATMPLAAVQGGGIDAVLAPVAIAQALVDMGHRLAEPQPREASQQAGADQHLRRIYRVLERACKVDFSHYKLGTVHRRLERRMTLKRMSTLADYVEYLESDATEAQSLCADLLIHVTGFFRNPESFEDLTTVVWPRLLDGRAPQATLRLWVPGCASGEEVYSIAISLLEFMGDRTLGFPIQIFGTDASGAAVAAARTGIFAESLIQDVSAERLKRFFVKLDGHYQVARQVRDLCVFSIHDVNRDPPFSRIDLLSCRNLLIYFDTVAQKRLFPVFHYALSSGGVLTLGPAETIGAASGFFRLLDGARTKIYVRKAVPGQARLELMESLSGRERPQAAAPVSLERPPLSEIELLQRDADRLSLTRYAPPAVLCDELLNVIQFRGDTAPYLTQPSGSPTTDLHKLARPGLLVEIVAAVQQARDGDGRARKTALRAEGGQGMLQVDVEVATLRTSAAAATSYLITFEPTAQGDGHDRPSRQATLFERLRGLVRSPRVAPDAAAAAHGEELAALRRELGASSDYIRTMQEQHQSALEELKSSQEEMLSSNEEFQSANEELETAKEELQSSNEELRTTNDELMHRNAELDQLAGRLKQAGAYADAIVETARESMLVLDSNLRVMRVNESFCTTFRMKRADCEQQFVYDLGEGQWNIPALRTLLAESLVQGKSFLDFEVTHVFASLGLRTMRLNARRLDLAAHDYILLAIEDVTERRSVLAALREEDLRKDEFLAMLGHELRNPLGAMRNALHIVASGAASSQVKSDALAMMGRQLDNETRLVDDLLDLSRIGRGAIEIARAPVDLGLVARLAVEEIDHVMRQRGHALALSLPPSSLLVDGDAMRLQQVIVNLLANSAKFTPSGGRIALAIERQGDEAVLTVTDDGIGIDAAMLPNVFGLFIQAKTSNDRSKGGLGLGLTLVRRLVDLHGGVVGIESAGLGSGSKVTVRLPVLAESLAVPANEAASGTGEPPVAPRRILVVDDNADVTSSTALLLEIRGHEVLTAADGLSAVALAEKAVPNAVLLDIGLPGIDGLEVARRLRQLPQTKRALLIAISGYGQDEDRRQALEAGFDHHLAKPVDVDQLVALLAKAGQAAD